MANNIVLLSIVFILFCPASAFAYLDPGTGSYLLQIFLGLFFGAFFAIKLYWRKIKNFFIEKFSKNKR